MKIAGVILARGGSKGIPNKNIIKINGKPLIQYSIDALIQSNCGPIFVSTNDRQIANVSKSLGANIINRPDDLATDISTSESALLHAVNFIDADIIIFVQPTSPLIEAKYINEGLEKLDKYDSVFSVFEDHWLPSWTEEITPIDWDINNRPRRQDKKTKLIENGAFYISKKKNILNSKLRYSGNMSVVKMPKSKSFQIDTNDDLKLVEKLL